MHLHEESDEYLDDIITLNHFPKFEPYEEYVQDLITIEDEVILDTSCNFNQKIFDEYINSNVKDTSTLPYSFCKIKENLEFLALCRPLSIRVTDCNKYPFYERDMAKIIYNKELEKNIQSKQNNNLSDDKFKELIGNKYDIIDAINVTSLNYNSNFKFLDINDKEITEHLIKDVKFDCINESQEYYMKSSIHCETDDFINVVDTAEDHLFNDISKPIRKNNNIASNSILEPCKKVGCICLSMDNKTQLINSKKIVPHYHKKKDDTIIRTENYLNQSKLKCQVTKGYDTCQNKIKKQKKIQILNDVIFQPNQTPVTYPDISDRYNLEKNIHKLKKSKTKHSQIKQTKKETKFNTRMKRGKEKKVITIEELQNKYFSNSTSSDGSKRMSIYTSECMPNPKKDCDVDMSPLNLSLKGQNVLKVNNLGYGKSYSSLKNNYRYTPYIFPMVDNCNLPNYVASMKSSVIQTPLLDTLRNNLQANYELNQDKCYNINERHTSRSRVYTETLLFNNTNTTLGDHEPFLYTSRKTYNNYKKNEVERGPRNSLKPSEINNQQDLCRESEIYSAVYKNGTIIANNISIEKTYNFGDKSYEQEIRKIKGICKNKYLEQAYNAGFESLSILKPQNEETNNDNVMTPCIGQSFDLILSNKLELQQDKSSSKHSAELKTNRTSLQNNEQKQTYAFGKQQDVATTNNIFQNSCPGLPVMNDVFISQNDMTVKNLSGTVHRKQLNEPTTNSPTVTIQYFNQQDKEYPVLNSCHTGHEIHSASKAVTDRSNSKIVDQIGTGYSPPILPIPTYQKVFEVLSQVNLMSKFKRTLECRNTNGSVDVLYNDVKLANRRISLDIQQYSKSSDTA